MLHHTVANILWRVALADEAVSLLSRLQRATSNELRATHLDHFCSGERATAAEQTAANKTWMLNLATLKKRIVQIPWADILLNTCWQ